jgi:hypothetical protein
MLNGAASEDAGSSKIGCTEYTKQYKKVTRFSKDLCYFMTLLSITFYHGQRHVEQTSGQCSSVGTPLGDAERPRGATTQSIVAR